MKTCAYITSDFFLDVDYPVVRELNRHFSLKWIVFIKIGQNARYSVEEVSDFAKRNSIELEIKRITARYRSIRQLMLDCKTVRELKKLKADIYYFQAFFDPYLPIFSRLFLNNRKIVVGIHDVVPHKRFRSKILRLNELLYFSMFRNYHLYSENQKYIFENTIHGENILLAKLTLKDFGPAKQIIRRDKINFLFFGVIQYNKGLDYLIQASNKLSEEYDNFRVTIAGKCDDFNPYFNLINNRSIYDLFIKVIPNQEIPELFANADYLVLPYRDVTQSGPLLIAYNYNLPVIASNFPGFSEYITDSINGYLFNSNDFESLYEVMKKVLNLSSENRSAVKVNLAKFVEDEISLDSIVSKYIRFFEQL